MIQNHTKTQPNQMYKNLNMSMNMRSEVSLTIIEKYLFNIKYSIKW